MASRIIQIGPLKPLECNVDFSHGHAAVEVFRMERWDQMTYFCLSKVGLVAGVGCQLH